jgi:hypothetical protein
MFMAKEVVEHRGKLVVVDAGCGSHREGHGQPAIFEYVKNLQFLLKEGLAAKKLIDPFLEAVELEGDDDLSLLELSKEPRLIKKSKAIRGEADANDFFPGEGFIDHVEELGMKEGLAAGEVDDIDLALCFKGLIKDEAEFIKREIPWTRGSSFDLARGIDADRTGEVASCGDLDDRHTEVLLVTLAEPAALRAQSPAFAHEYLRHRCRLHISLGPEVFFQIAPDKNPGFSVFGTELMEIDVPAVGYDLRRHDGSTAAADRLRHPEGFHQCLFTEV